MINKLYNDLAVCNSITKQGEILGCREIITPLINDKDGHPRQIVIDATIDKAPDGAGRTINKIYEAYYSKPNEAFWVERITMFEYTTNVDWFLMLSYLYMVNECNDNTMRAFKTIADAAKVLCQIDADTLKKDPAYMEYAKMMEYQQTLSGVGGGK